MINSKDLRVGNFLSDHQNNIITILEISENTVRAQQPAHYTATAFGYHVLNLRTLPLTEKRLIQLGFVLEDKGSFGVYTLGEFTFNTNHNHFWIGNNWGFFKEPKHVHELQNLYFAITGLELNTDNLS